ncbi:hypothetical protein NEOLEDRAFT_1140027 [Neolentinus lepideus HHB14362 ss-1]|uniref:Uncharacterized protein n=1 Tax=Neolentinus lepideus HHB14362 ss-1 TaxID=1314782 RepID=A0A165PG54_9AGAM|nr:hypothetical protein NEOLEDRAFT_1140027 [Neolentinus lepideus HHB14362 ss-1]
MSNKHTRPPTANEILARTSYQVPPLQHAAMLPTILQNPQHPTTAPSYTAPTSVPVSYYPYYLTTPHVQRPYNMYYPTPTTYSMPYYQYSPP